MQKIPEKNLNLSNAWWRFSFDFYLKLTISFLNLVILVDGKNRVSCFLANLSQVVPKFEGSAFNHFFTSSINENGNNESLTYSMKPPMGMNISMISKKFYNWTCGSLCERTVNYRLLGNSCTTFLLSSNQPPKSSPWKLEVTLVMSRITT